MPAYLPEVLQKLQDTPRMLGRDPIPYLSGRVYMRRSDAVPEGYQVFAKAEGNPAVPDVKGNLLAIDHLITPRPELVGKFNTLILNPRDYEAVKKSMMEAPKRDAARADRKSRMPGMSLAGFKPNKAFER